MLTDVEKILRENDKGANPYCPPGFDWHVSRDKASQLVKTLSVSLGMTLTLDDKIQDASYSFRVELAKTRLENHKFVQKNVFETCCVYLSNFGNLAMIGSPELISSKAHELTIEVLKNAGYIFIPNEYLIRDYDGVHDDREYIKTWCGRFFGYF